MLKDIEEGEHLDSLAQPHLICQHAARALHVVLQEPDEALDLVVVQQLYEGGGAVILVHRVGQN